MKKSDGYKKESITSEDIPDEKELKDGSRIVTKHTPTGNFIRVLGVISGLICIIAGIWLLLIYSDANNIYFAFLESLEHLQYYHAIGLFFIGIGLFVIMLSWGISHLIDKKIWIILISAKYMKKQLIVITLLLNKLA